MTPRPAGLTGMTRALACLALEHSGDDDSCPSSDEELAQALVQEIRRLRQLCGEEPEPTERIVAALADALDGTLPPRVERRPSSLPRWANGTLALLADDGWTIIRTPQ